MATLIFQVCLFAGPEHRLREIKPIVFIKILNDSAILMKAAYAVVEGFPKAASSHMNGFPKVLDLNNFCRFVNTVCSGFQTPIHVAISSFRKLFHDSKSCFQNLLSNRNWARVHLQLSGKLVFLLQSAFS